MSFAKLHQKFVRGWKNRREASTKWKSRTERRHKNLQINFMKLNYYYFLWAIVTAMITLIVG